MSFTIYHNPRCSKSRQTLELLKEKTSDINIVEYLKQPPSVDELTDIIAKLGISPLDLCRKKESEFTEAGLDQEHLTDEDIISRMVKFPKVIERPIVVTNHKAIIGRPPENVLELI